MTKKNNREIYESNKYIARVERWLDGDTVELSVDLGMKTSIRAKFRLARIDAPEVKRYAGVTTEEKARGIELVVVSSTKKGKYGRYLVEIWDEDCDGNMYTLNDWLLNEGLVEGVSY